MVQQEVIEAELRHLQSWNDLHAQNSVSRKSIVVVTIYDSDEEDGSSSRTASCSTPDDSAGDRSSPDVGEIAIIQLCPNSKGQTSSLNLQTRQTVPIVPTNPTGAQDTNSISNHSSVCNIAVSGPDANDNISRHRDITGSTGNGSPFYLETISDEAGHREESEDCLGEPQISYNANSYSIGGRDNRNYVSRPLSYDTTTELILNAERNPLTARNYIIRLREAAESAMNSCPLRDSSFATVDRLSTQEATFNYQTFKNLFNSYRVISESVPLDYSTKNRAGERNNHETNNMANKVVDEQYEYTVDISNTDRPDIDTVVVDDIDINRESIDEGVVDEDVDGENCTNEGAVDENVLNDGVITYVDEPEDGVLMDTPYNGTDGVENSPVGSATDVIIDGISSNMDVNDSMEQLEPSIEEEIPDIRIDTIENVSLSRPMQRRSKRIPNKQSGSDNKKRKCSEVNGRTRATSGTNEKKQLNKKACTNPSAGTKRGESASKSPAAPAAAAADAASASAAAEKRARRGGVATRARSRNLLSVGSVWRRPTPSDMGPRRSWPVAGMHERPVWPLAGDAAPPSPPRPPRSPSPDPADLARQRDIEIRLHWALAACFQIHKDAKEAEKQKILSSTLMPIPQTRRTTFARPEDRSVQEIYIESRLYRFLDNELSKIFSKNGKLNNKFRDVTGSFQNQTSQPSIYPFYFSQCPLLGSLRNCLRKEFEEHTIKSDVEGSLSLDSARNELKPNPKNKTNNGIDCMSSMNEINSNLESNNIQHSSSLDERKGEMLEKICRYIEGNYINKNLCSSVSSQESPILERNKGKGNNPLGSNSRDENRRVARDLNCNEGNVKNNSEVSQIANSDISSILDALCCILYPIAREYCKINNITSDVLALYVETLTPNLLIEWIEKNIEYESERL